MIPIPMNETEPSTMKTAAVAKLACVRSSSKKRASTISTTTVCTNPNATA